MINTKKGRKNLYLRLNRINLVKKLSKLLGAGGRYYLRMEDGKFMPNRPSMGHQAPWVYVKGSGARCDLYHRVFFDVLKHIPSYCRSCWKVVVMPRNLVELFNLYELQREMGVPCKCGIELRKTDSRLYGGYFYCRSLEEGQKRYEEVRELVNKHLSESTPVILKRYCTEFEIGPDGKGPSNEVPDCTDEELEFEEFVAEHFPRVWFGNVQPDHLTASVMVDWIHHAHERGDPTYKEFTDGSPLFKPIVTYHKEEKDG